MIEIIKPEYQESIGFLNMSLKRNEINRSFLLYGNHEEDMDIIAKAFAKKILCQVNGRDKCSCKSCLVFNKERDNLISHPDLIGYDFEWSMESKAKNGVEGIRKIVHQLQISPLWGRNKVAILRYVDSFNKESANTLLKTIEEPYPSTTIILLAKNLNRIIDTITSRTINLGLQAKAVENSELTDTQKDWIKLIKSDLVEKFSLSEKIVKSNKEKYFLEFIYNYFGNIIRMALVKNKQLSVEDVAVMKNFMKKAKQKKDLIMDTNVNKRLTLDNLFLETEDIIKVMDKIEA